MDKRDWKYILKRVITFFIIYLILHFATGCKMVHAYVVVSNGANWTTISTQTSAITNPLNTWPNSGYVFSPAQDAWLTSIGQYWYASQINGRYLKVNADFYLGIETMPGVANPTDYLNSTRNPITANNLRCGIGTNIGSGYDNTYSPKVSNFSATMVHDLSSNNYPHTVYHITFTYEQQLGSDRSGASNMSCWFVSSGTQLFVQLSGSVASQLLFQYTPTLQYSVTQDQTNSQLNTITQQNQQMINNQNTMINQNNQIIQEEKNTQNKINENTNAINNQTDTIKDTNISGANTEMNSFLDSIKINDNKGISGIITMPLRLVNNFNRSCSPISLPLPFLNENAEIPCMKPIYNRFIGTTAVTIISELINTFIIYNALVLLFVRTKQLKDPEEDKVEVVFL